MYNQLINRYRMKSGTDIANIEKYAKENGHIFNIGGSWISDNSEHVLFIVLNDSLSLDIALPKELEKWDDLENVIVMDDNLGQPYGPFYSYLKNPAEELDPYLKSIIDKYNRIMSSMPFIEKRDNDGGEPQ